MNMRKLASIGIDVGGTKTRMALFDDKFEVIEDIKFRTPNTEKEFAAEFTRSGRKLVNMAVFGRLTITAVGIGVAGSVDGDKEVITFAPNVPFVTRFPFNKIFHGLCGCHTVLINDAHAALYGELKLGKAVGYKD